MACNFPLGYDSWNHWYRTYTYIVLTSLSLSLSNAVRVSVVCGYECVRVCGVGLCECYIICGVCHAGYHNSIVYLRHLYKPEVWVRNSRRKNDQKCNLSFQHSGLAINNMPISPDSISQVSFTHTRQICKANDGLGMCISKHTHTPGVKYLVSTLICCG